MKPAVIGVKVFLSVPYLFDKILSCFYKRSMKYCGKNVNLRPGSSDFKGLYNLSIGDDSSLPKGSILFCTEAELIIGNHVIFGPRPTIITGDHRIDRIGKFITSPSEKLPENDASVIVEDDVWVGANVTILKGVTIGRGSVIAAGAVVTKSCPPYSIIGGVPARILKYRFSESQILEHEKKLYPIEKRLSPQSIIRTSR
ncbi:acyltransferase [Alistipes sp.]|uniref:acyltransferase n=1 Tax=Alistipes sp. TaxID=1872444 RepID=UPI003AF16BA4